MLPKLVEMGMTSRKVKKYLTHYKNIMSVTLAELGEDSFAEYVRHIIEWFA